jgi:hypothetical protein
MKLNSAINYDVQGNAGHNPTSEELVMALENCDLFLYFGHGSVKPRRLMFSPSIFVGCFYQCRNYLKFCSFSLL